MHFNLEFGYRAGMFENAIISIYTSIHIAKCHCCKIPNLVQLWNIYRAPIANG